MSNQLIISGGGHDEAGGFTAKKEYLSNIEDETLLSTETFQKKLGLAILLGLDRYFFEGQSFKY